MLLQMEGGAGVVGDCEMMVLLKTTPSHIRPIVSSYMLLLDVSDQVGGNALTMAFKVRVCTGAVGDEWYCSRDSLTPSPFRTIVSS